MSRSVIEYFGVDYELVWDIIENELEELNFQKTNILKAELDRLKQA